MQRTATVRRIERHAATVRFTINWIADYPSPYALYSLLLLPEATSNYGHWDDAEFVRLLEAASGAETEADQAAAYRAVDARVDSEAPIR